MHSVANGPITLPPGRDHQRKLPLEMTITKFTCGAVRSILVGDLDLFGAERLDLPLATLAGAGGDVVVDMTRLRGIAAIGIRHLVSAARTLGRSRGRLSQGTEPNLSDLNQSTVGEDFGRAIFRRIIESSSDEIMYLRDLLP